MERKAWPYMAGIIDSEGTICIAVSHRVFSEISRPHVRLTITVSNTDVRLMKWLVANFGGTYTKKRNDRGFSHHGSGIIYRWDSPGASQKKILQGILPYIVLKKEQVKLAIEYCSLGLRWNVDKRVDMAKQCQHLNHSFPRDLNIFLHNKIGAYAAGVMDGDGSFYVARATLNPQVSLTSKSLRMILWFMYHYGGHFTSRLLEDGNLAYNWKLSGRKNKEKFLLSVLPYLELKKEQANILLKLIRMSGAHNQSIRETLANQCCVLNNLQSTVTTDTPSDSTEIEDTVCSHK